MEAIQSIQRGVRNAILVTSVMHLQEVRNAYLRPAATASAMLGKILHALETAK